MSSFDIHFRRSTAVLLSFRPLLWVRDALALLGLAVVLVSTTPLVPWWARKLAGPWNDPVGDVVIVFGAEGMNHGLIGLETYWRTAYAADAGAEGSLIVVSGGGNIATSMKQLLSCYGLPADRIIAERRSCSTRENALYTAQLIRQKPGKKVLLTSDFHMYRSIRALRKAGVEAEPRPFPYILKRWNNWTQRVPLFLELCVESVKIVWYRWQGWI